MSKDNDDEITTTRYSIHCPSFLLKVNDGVNDYGDNEVYNYDEYGGND